MSNRISSKNVLNTKDYDIFKQGNNGRYDLWFSSNCNFEDLLSELKREFRVSKFKSKYKIIHHGKLVGYIDTRLLL